MLYAVKVAVHHSPGGIGWSQRNGVDCAQGLMNGVSDHIGRH